MDVIEVANRLKIKCSNCGHKSERISGSKSLTLEVPRGLKSITFQNLLSNYFRPENLDDYRCEVCDTKGLVSKAYRFTELPEYLVVTLNRTSQRDVLGDNRYVKNGAKVSISTDNLNVADFCDQSCNHEGQSYSICGLVQHAGTW